MSKQIDATKELREKILSQGARIASALSDKQDAAEIVRAVQRIHHYLADEDGEIALVWLAKNCLDDVMRFQDNKLDANERAEVNSFLFSLGAYVENCDLSEYVLIDENWKKFQKSVEISSKLTSSSRDDAILSEENYSAYQKRASSKKRKSIEMLPKSNATDQDNAAKFLVGQDYVSRLRLASSTAVDMIFIEIQKVMEVLSVEPLSPPALVRHGFETGLARELDAVARQSLKLHDSAESYGYELASYKKWARRAADAMG